MSDQPRSGRSRWTRTVEGRFGPLSSGTESEPRAKAARTIGGTEAILLVEDHDDVRDVTRIGLERLGYRVDAVQSADEALRYVQGGAEFDLLLADVVLPGMNGVAMAERIVALRGGLRVLFVSAYASEESVPHRTMSGQPCAFLPKPYGLHALSAVVRDLLDRES